MYHLIKINKIAPNLPVGNKIIESNSYTNNYTFASSVRVHEILLNSFPPLIFTVTNGGSSFFDF